jgi:hypothetical protein
VRSRRDRGSTLLFFPAALLVVVVLASITVDLARLRLVQRQADDAASAAANDAVTAGLDIEALRRGDDYRLDPRRVARIVDRTVRVHDHAGIGALAADVELTGVRSVAVDITGRVPVGFARVLPGAPAEVTVASRASAVASLR